MCNHFSTLLRLFVLCLLSTVAAGAQIDDSLAAAEGNQAQPVNCAGYSADDFDFKQIHTGVTMHVGVDVLGRITAATDYDGDGIANDVMIFAAPTRLTEPKPTFLKGAKVTVIRGGMMVEAADRSLALAVSVSGDVYPELPIPRDWKKSYSQVIVEDDGIMFLRQEPPPTQQHSMAAYDHNSIYSWPSNFQRDFILPQTGGGGQCGPGCIGSGCTCVPPPGGCDTGGCGTPGTACGSPCSGGPVDCGDGYFPCTRCVEEEDGDDKCFSTCLECGFVDHGWPPP